MATLADKDKEIEQLKNTLNSTQTQLNDKKEALGQAYATRDRYEQENAKLKEDVTAEKVAHATTTAERDSLQDELGEATTTIIDLNQKLSKAQAAPGQVRTVEHGGKTYQVQVPRFRLDGKIYSAEEVTTGSDVLAELVRLKSGALVEVAA